MVVTDIDGTLLDEQGEVTPRARAVLKELERRGVPVVLCTGRGPISTEPLYRALGLRTPAITHNGALTYQPGRPEPILHHPIPGPVALQLVDCIRAVSPETNIGVSVLDRWYVDRIDERIAARLAAGSLPAAPVTGDVKLAIAAEADGISTLYYRGDERMRRAVQAQLAARGLDGEVAATSSGFALVEYLAAGVSKGAAVRALAAAMGIPREQVVALGDMETDIPLLQAAGLGIAMGNADPAVKGAAAVVAGPNSADGWAAAIERYVLAG